MDGRAEIVPLNWYKKEQQKTLQINKQNKRTGGPGLSRLRARPSMNFGRTLPSPARRHPPQTAMEQTHIVVGCFQPHRWKVVKNHLAVRSLNFSGHWKATGRSLGKSALKIATRNLEIKGGGTGGPGRGSPCTPPTLISKCLVAIFNAAFPKIRPVAPSSGQSGCPVASQGA